MIFFINISKQFQQDKINGANSGDGSRSTGKLIFYLVYKHD